MGSGAVGNGVLRMKQPKKRFVFSNYNQLDRYNNAREELIALYGEIPTEAETWEYADELTRIEWADERQNLHTFFNGDSWLAMGSVGLWTGNHAAGTVFDNWDEFFHSATKDCDYWEIWDENGHLYMRCSHHDGTNYFEIKRLSRRGVEVLENWEFDYTNETPEEIMHETLWGCNLFSGLPHFAHTVYGCPKQEMEDETK